MKKKLLITGVSGLLGSNLAYSLRDRYEISGLYLNHEITMDKVSIFPCDLRKKLEIEKILNGMHPDIVIHCAAQANVDICEEKPQEAEELNVKSTKNLVESLPQSTKFIYISTDLVYDGIKGNFKEDDPTGPLNVYARTKLEGEKEALKARGSLVFRTNFYGWNIKNKESLGEWVVNALSANKEINGFTDAIFSSIYTFDLARLMDKAIREDIAGVYNLGSSGFLSKYGFAKAIADKLGLDAGLIKPMSIDDFGFKAKRSKDLSLDVSKLERDIGADSLPVEISIENFIRGHKDGISNTFKTFSEKEYKS